MALERGLAVIALTDHDTMAGVAEAQEAADGTGLEVIPGVEINSEIDHGDLHILGYYVAPEHLPLQEKLTALRNGRLTRAREMVARLSGMGMALAWEDVQALAGGESIGRPHIARALCENGYVETIQEAFDRFLSRGGAAYVPRLRLAPHETIAAIAAAGGVPVLAHPAHSGPHVLAHIPEFVAYGLRGLEVYYPHHTPGEVEQLLALCQTHDLLATGGSDFHRPAHTEGASLGSVHVPMSCVERLREAAGR